MCKTINIDGTVDIPMAVEALYGFVFGKIQAKHASGRLPRVIIGGTVEEASIAENDIAKMRSEAVLADLGLPFPLSSELTSNMLNNIDINKDAAVPVIVNSSAVVLNPSSDEDCNADDFSGTWKWYNMSSIPNTVAACCAQSCSGLLDTVGIAPSKLSTDICCSACNKYECSPADGFDSFSISKASLVQVPSLQTSHITTVSMNI
jgi:hypothetical protein